MWYTVQRIQPVFYNNIFKLSIRDKNVESVVPLELMYYSKAVILG